jgi:hypothetical protein
MSDPEHLTVTAAVSKPSYANGEVPEFSASVKTIASEPVYADLQWGLSVLPDGQWVDYSREYAVHTDSDTGEATWHWPGDEVGPPDPGDYEIVIDAHAFDDTGHEWGQGSAGLTFRVSA